MAMRQQQPGRDQVQSENSGGGRFKENLSML
jgi:hypothetical protein